MQQFVIVKLSQLKCFNRLKVWEKRMLRLVLGERLRGTDRMNLICYLLSPVPHFTARIRLLFTKICFLKV